MKIRFNILEEQLQELKYISIEEFDEFANIEGLFEFIIDNIRFGYVDNDIPFSNELLISWFKILNRASMELIENNKCIVSYIPDSNKWLEIEIQGEKIKITELELMEKNVEFLINNQKCSDLFKYSNKIDVIEKKEFINCILENTHKFINNISNINEKLIYSKAMQELISLYIKVKN